MATAVSKIDFYSAFNKHVSTVLKLLPKKVVTGIISYSFHIILNEIKKQVFLKDKTVLDFNHSNSIKFYKIANDSYCKGELGKTLLTPLDKLFYLKKEMEKNNKTSALIIGHSSDEMAMVDYIKGTKGLSILKEIRNR